MATDWGSWSWKLCSAWLAIGGALARVVVLSSIAIFEDCAIAQIAPDGTLGAESSVVTLTNIDGLPTERIDGGATRGANLFHSFEQFSVPTGGAAYFNNALDIQNIISRVTSRSVSNIDGLLRANGTANLFLLNPNGIIFGPNATLAIGGSFLASTAGSLNFADGTQFSATAPQTTPLLTVSVPLGLQYGGTAGSILNQSQATNSSGELVGLQVQSGKTLAFVGGEVRLDGGSLQAPGGRVELGGVAGAGTVGLQVDGNNLILSYPASVQRADVSLTNGAIASVAAGGDGSIAINARNIDVLGGSYLFAGIDSSLGSGTAVAGDVTLNATGTIALKQSSNIINGVSPNATGNSGNIDIQAESLDLENAFLSASTFGQGNGGTININARDRVSLTGRGAYSQVEPDAVGNSGGINITTGSLFLTNSELLAHTKGKGNAGTININAGDRVSLVGSLALSEVQTGAEGNSGGINVTTGSLSLTNGSVLATNTYGQGNGSTIKINARNSVFFAKSLALSEVKTGAVGNSGGIDITTGSLALTNDSALATSTFGRGNGGTVNINAHERVSFTEAGGVYSQVEPEAEGNSGGINVTTGSLSLTNGVKLLAHTKGKGNAGTININAGDRVSLVGSLALSEVQTGAEGNSGGINVTTGSLSLTNGSVLATNTYGQGNGGEINIMAKSLFVTDGTQLIASTFGQGKGGSININTQDVQLIGRNADGQVSGLFAEAANSSGDAGNLAINTDTLLIKDGAGISASTDGRGNGGNVTINTRDLLIQNWGGVSALTSGEGNAGNLTVTADRVQLTGNTPDGKTAGAMLATAEIGAKGEAGKLTITTRELLLEDGAQISAGTWGENKGGELVVNATESVQLIGGLPTGGLASSLNTKVFGTATGNGET